MMVKIVDIILDLLLISRQLSQIILCKNMFIYLINLIVRDSHKLMKELNNI